MRHWGRGKVEQQTPVSAQELRKAEERPGSEESPRLHPVGPPIIAKHIIRTLLLGKGRPKLTQA